MADVMRILIPALLSLLVACGKDTTDADPCAKAVANAERLVKENPSAQQLYGERPLTDERCRSANAREVSCIAYASDWKELEGCSPTVLGSR
jgi:hypothetical protein